MRFLTTMTMAAGAGAVAWMALPDDRRRKLRAWLRERLGEVNGDPIDEARGKFDQFAATSAAFSGTTDDVESRLDGDDGAAADRKAPAAP